MLGRLVKLRPLVNASSVLSRIATRNRVRSNALGSSHSRESSSRTESSNPRRWMGAVSFLAPVPINEAVAPCAVLCAALCAAAAVLRTGLV
jgi:hypothetical protein